MNNSVSDLSMAMNLVAGSLKTVRRRMLTRDGCLSVLCFLFLCIYFHIKGSDRSGVSDGLMNRYVHPRLYCITLSLAALLVIHLHVIAMLPLSYMYD